MRELAKACDKLESSLERMVTVQWGSAIAHPLPLPWVAEEPKGELQEVEDDQGDGRWDQHFNHSWAVSGPRPGWYWIPKGRLSQDQVYPAGLSDRRRFGYLARKVRSTPKPPPLAVSFVSVVRDPKMVNRE